MGRQAQAVTAAKVRGNIGARTADEGERAGDVRLKFLPTLATQTLRSSQLRHIIGFVFTIAATIGIWAAVVAFLKPQSYILPSPWAVATEMWANKSLLLSQGSATIQEVVFGYLLGIAVAIPCAIAIVALPGIGRVVQPLIVAFNSVPKVALAPLFVVWMGYGILPRIIIVFLITFFPIFMNSVAGLSGTDPDFLKLARTMNATRTRVFVRIRLPASLPSVFAGLKVSASLAVIGGVIAEFVASTEGWGFLLLRAQGELNTALIFGIAAMLALLATALYAIVSLIERFVLRWHPSRRN